jgi:hypothetical protein
MTEREPVVDKYKIKYEGLFSSRELYKLIDVWFEDRGYEKKEMRNVEIVKPEGKYVQIDLEPWKCYTDYAKFVIKIKYMLTDLKEVEIEKDNVKVKLNQGKILLIFDSWVETDYFNRWETKPLFFFLRTVFDKYIYKPYTMGYRSKCREDTMTLITQIKSFLNLYQNK